MENCAATLVAGESAKCSTCDLFLQLRKKKE